MSSEALKHVNVCRIFLAHQAVEDDQYREALQSLLSAEFAPSSADVLDSILSKHSRVDLLPPFLDPTPQPVCVNPGSCKGVTLFLQWLCLRPLMPQGHSSQGNCLLTLSSQFCPVGSINLICSVTASSSILCGSHSPSVSEKRRWVQPIAIGEVFCCLRLKCVARAAQSEAIHVFFALQVDVGVTCGCEAIVHSVSSLISNHAVSVNSCCILLIACSLSYPPAPPAN